MGFLPHCVLRVAPGPPVICPLPHGTHSPSIAPIWYVPSGHIWHEPVEAVAWPGEHGAVTEQKKNRKYKKHW